VIDAHPSVRFWAYTRSFVGRVNVVPILAGAPNLALYLSTDRHNVAAASTVVAAHPTARTAWCGETWDDAASVADGAPMGPRCPENTKKLPLVLDGVGACQACGLCVNGKGNVRFSIRKV
jgi:hypothetical protein